ncbi:DNA polymerase alpha accessory factor Mcl1 [Tilletia horrida]|nr:DNA polymerase alpha accessory factor Mcl1 [Tilletia horrida]
MDAETEPHVAVVHTSGLTRVLHAPASAGVDRLFTAGNDYLVRLLPTSHQSSQDPLLIEDAQGPISWIDADQENLVVGSHDGCVRVYSHKGASSDLAEGGGHLETQAAQPTDLVQILTRTSLPTRCVAIERAPRNGAQSARVAVCSDDLSVKVVALNDPMQVSLLTGHTRPLRAAAWSPRSALLVTTSCDGMAKIWDLALSPVECVGTIENALVRLTAESELASLPLWHPSGKYFLLPSKDNEFSIVTCTGGTWAVTGKFTAPVSDKDSVNPGTGDITFMAFSPNGRYLAAATSDKQVTIWETTPGRRRPMALKKADSNVTGISWHPSKDALAWTDDVGNLIRWDGAVGEANPSPFEKIAFGMGISATKATGRTAEQRSNDKIKARTREPDQNEDLFFGGEDDDEEDMDVDRNADVGRGLMAHEAGHDGDASEDEDEDALDQDDGDMDDFLVDDEDGGAAADSVGLAATAYARELAQERQLSKLKSNRSQPTGVASGLSGVSIKSQIPFQPTSTPMREQRRYLAFNMLGSLMAIDQGTHQTVQFESHDTSARRNFRMVDYHRFSLGALAFHGALLGVPASTAAESAEDVESGLSSVTYRPFEHAWGGAGGEWTINLPQGESVELIALGGPAPPNARRDDLEDDEAANTRSAAAVVATSAGYLRFFSATGMQRYIWSYGKPVVSMAAGVRSVLIVYRAAGVALDDWQTLYFDLIDLDSFQVRHTGSVPLVKGRALRWVGFNEWDIPAMYDSAGVLSVLDGAHKPSSYICRWTPVLETAGLTLTPPGETADGAGESGGRKGKINYWPVGLSSTHLMCLMLKGSALPDPHGARPLIQDVELKMPILNPEAPSAILEEKWMRQTLVASMTRDAIRSGIVAALTTLTSVAPPDPVKLEHDADKDLLQLIQLACKGDRHGRALDAARELSSARTLDAAVSIAGFFHLPSLAERMGSLREEVERRAFEREGAGISEMEREWELELEMRRKWATHGLGDTGVLGQNNFDASGSRLLAPSTQESAPARRSQVAAAASKALAEGFAPRSALSKAGNRRSLGRSASVTFSPMVEEQSIPSNGDRSHDSWPDLSVNDQHDSLDFVGEDDISGERHGDLGDSYMNEVASSPPAERREKRKSPADEDSDIDMPPSKTTSKKSGNPFSATNRPAKSSNPFARTASNASVNGRGADKQMHKSTSFFDRVDAVEGRAGGKGPAAKKHKQQTLFDMAGGKKKSVAAGGGTSSVQSVKQTKKTQQQKQTTPVDDDLDLEDGNESTSPNGKVAGSSGRRRTYEYVEVEDEVNDEEQEQEQESFELPTPSFASNRMVDEVVAEEEIRSTLEAAQRKGEASQHLEETQYSREDEETQARTESQSAAGPAPTTGANNIPVSRGYDQIPIVVAPRPDKGGTAGTPLNLVANVFKLNFRGEPGVVTHYDVIIVPDEDPAEAEEFRRRREERAQAAPGRARKERPPPPSFLQEIFNQCAVAHARVNDRFTNEIAAAISFDGRRNAYTTKPLNLPEGVGSTTFHTTLPIRQDLGEVPGHPASRPQNRPPRREPRPRKFKITMTLVANINLADLVAFCNGDRDVISDAQNASASGTTPSVLTAIQTLEVALRSNALARPEYHIRGAAGRKFFSDRNTVPISAGVEIWRGFFQSVRPMRIGPGVNLDVATSPFLGSGDLIEVITRILGGGGGGGGGFRGGRGGPRGGGGFRGGGRGGPPQPGVPSGQGHAGGARPPNFLGPREARDIRTKLRGIQIRLNHRASRKTYKFLDLTSQPAAETSFDRNGQQINIVQYFQQNYNISIRYPGLPCVVYNRQGGRPEFVPMELISIVPGAPVNGFTLSGPQRQDMIAVSSMMPIDRRARTEEIRQELNYDADPKLQAWQLSVDRDMLKVPGRVLPPPQIIYGDSSQPANPRDGAWNLARARFINPGRNLLTWAIVNFTKNPAHVIQGFTANLIREMQNLGMAVTNIQPHYADGGRDITQIKKILHEAGRAAYRQAQAIAQQRNEKAPPPQLIVCFMDETDAGFYDTIKRTAALDLVTPVPSQVLNTRKALGDRGQQQYAANVAMKLNIKLGGANWTVPDRDLPGLTDQTMIVGADVTHPVRGSGRPSIAASVATMNGARTKYSAEIRAQRHVGGQAAAQEIIIEAGAMMEGHLRRWAKENNGQLPKSICIFRDGVSEGQFTTALNTEYEAIQKTCKALAGEGKEIPKITFVVASKNHNVRFYAEDPRRPGATDRSGNVVAGTVIDSHITHPFVFDFYLQAHAGLIGTARPTHYIVLKDENNFTSDDLQRTVHTLCYTYARATRSVSLIPPAYYADVLADKCRALVWDPVADDQSTVSGTSSDMQPLSAADAVRVMKRLEVSPDFCESLWFMVRLATIESLAPT